MYVTVVLTGLGLEYLVWCMLLTGDWDEVKKNKWKFVQFLFSLLSVTAIGLATQGNYLALPCLVITMWKCGFPSEILRPDNFTELIHYNESLTLLKQPFGQVFLYHIFFQETVLLIYSALYEIKTSFIERFIDFYAVWERLFNIHLLPSMLP